MASGLSPSSDETNLRVVALIDMDCFYVQVMQRQSFGTHWDRDSAPPCAVLQYTGGCIAVDYKARRFGVRKGLFKEEILRICPEAKLFYVPQKNGKADLTIFRRASEQVFEVICERFGLVEKASIDEAFIDITEEALHLQQVKNFQDTDKKTQTLDGDEEEESIEELIISSNTLIVGIGDTGQIERHNTKISGGGSLLTLYKAVKLLHELRKEIYERLSFQCSCGIATNKMLAKLVCSFNKPNGQSLLPICQTLPLLGRTRVESLRKFGGKFGRELRDIFQINYVAEIGRIEPEDLVGRFGQQTAATLLKIGRGIDEEPVVNRTAAKSIGSSKDFIYTPLRNASDVEKWLANICRDLRGRFEEERQKSKRLPQTLTLGLRVCGAILQDESNSSRFSTPGGIMKSKSCRIESLDNLEEISGSLLAKSCIDFPGGQYLTYLSLSGSNMRQIDTTSHACNQTLTLHNFVTNSVNVKPDTQNSSDTELNFKINSSNCSNEASFFANEDLSLKGLDLEDKREGLKRKQSTSSSEDSKSIQEPNNDKIRCEECGELVSGRAKEFLAHKDFHFAQAVAFEELRERNIIDYETNFGLKQAPKVVDTKSISTGRFSHKVVRKKKKK